ncbi:MAG: hypothetical protein IJZ94_01750 [Clostridia bacterium]|nr:hypothetical protein [Clostridia bacterium]
MIRFAKSPLAPDGMSDTTDLYKVKVNGLTCDVHQARVSAMPFNRTWPGKQRSIDQTEIAGFICFEADEKVTLEVECNKAFKKAFVKPFSKNITTAAKGNIITFDITENGQYVLELDDDHEALHIFVNNVNDYADGENATYYFGPGVHFPGLIRVKSGDTVYVDKEAIVYGSILGESVHDVRIFGYGIIDGTYEERIIEHCYLPSTKGNIKFYDSHDILIEGVVLRNSAIWVISLFGCHNVDIENIKIIGQWRYNTDGVDICNSGDVVVRNSFIRAFDDVITIKGIPEYKHLPVGHIAVENCVMWCGWGRNIEIGIETYCTEFSNILFKNCELIHSSAACIDIQNGGVAEISDIKFENINVEYSNTCLPEIYHEYDEMKYEPGDRIGMPNLIYSDNFKFILPETTEEEKNNYGVTHGIIYKNINVYLDEGLPMPRIHIGSRSADAIHYDFIIDGLYVNGKKIENLEEMTYHPDPNVKQIFVL